MFYPSFESMADSSRFNQGIAGVMDNIVRKNFAEFVSQASVDNGHAVLELERVPDDGATVPLNDDLIDQIDTLVIISFDSMRTNQEASDDELRVVRRFLAKPGNLLFICPHHDIGYVNAHENADLLEKQTAEFRHHGDRAIPPQQRFGGFARSLLAGLGIPIENRFGLHPASEPDGAAAAIDAQSECATLWSSTAGGTDSLRRLWSNVCLRSQMP
jgi:hypothetical protein